MGKAAIILVLAGGIAVAYGALSSQETGHMTAKKQANYEETILAREIARSGFNAAMSILRQHGEDLQTGVLAIMGEDGHLEGQSQGGTYRARARFISGHTVEVSSVGYFGGSFAEEGEYVGGASYTIDDNFTHHLPRVPLQVSQCTRLNVEYLASSSEHCAAVYMVRRLPGAEPAPPELVFASASSRPAGSQLPVTKAMVPGTQLNFFIGVDPNCTQAPPDWTTYNYDGHIFNESNYSHVHYALEKQTSSLSAVREAIWALVEQHPDNNQRWRISWEAQHQWNITNPKHGHFHDPTRSLLALKMYGYDSAGWPEKDARGYRALRSYSGRPDLSDQIIEVSVQPVDDCLELVVGDPEDWEDPNIAGGIILPGGPNPLIGLDETGSCPCPGLDSIQDHRMMIKHLPPGNPDNYQKICIDESAWSHHQKHGDAFYCRGA